MILHKSKKPVPALAGNGLSNNITVGAGDETTSNTIDNSNLAVWRIAQQFALPLLTSKLIAELAGLEGV